MNNTENHSDKNISIYVPDGCLGMSVDLVVDLCWTASQYSAESCGQSQSNTSLSNLSQSKNLQLISIDGNPVETMTRQTIRVDGDLSLLPKSSTLFIAAFATQVKQALVDNKAFIAALSDLHRQGTPIAVEHESMKFLSAFYTGNRRKRTTVFTTTAHGESQRTARRRFAEFLPQPPSDIWLNHLKNSTDFS